MATALDPVTDTIGGSLGPSSDPPLLSVSTTLSHTNTNTNTNKQSSSASFSSLRSLHSSSNETASLSSLHLDHTEHILYNDDDNCATQAVTADTITASPVSVGVVAVAAPATSQSPVTFERLEQDNRDNSNNHKNAKHKGRSRYLSLAFRTLYTTIFPSLSKETSLASAQDSGRTITNIGTDENMSAVMTRSPYVTATGKQTPSTASPTVTHAVRTNEDAVAPQASRDSPSITQARTKRSVVNNATISHVSASNHHHLNSKNPMRGAVTVIPDRLYFCALNADPAAAVSTATASNNPSNKPSAGRVLHLRNPFHAPSQHAYRDSKDAVYFFSVDQELVYWNFFLDFGPLNLGQLYRFTERLNQALRQHRKVCLYSSASARNKRANAVYCICAWQVLYMNRTPEEACYGFLKAMSGLPSPTTNSSLPPIEPITDIGRWTTAALPPFHDASPCACTYDLTLLNCLRGLQKARQYNFFTWNDFGRCRKSDVPEQAHPKTIDDILRNNERNPFDVQEYEHFEQVENGDLNWIVEGRILAFAGPSFKKTVTPEGFCTLAPSDYIPYFKKKKVGLVVRLNQRMYDENDFRRAGIRHLEQFYLDGSCPPMKILRRVVAAFEEVPQDQAFAVHCKAGLGRTGTCIGAYLMKHYRFSAAEAIGWMRICRPGMVIGPQQHFLEQIQDAMWHEGDRLRQTAQAKHLMVELCNMPSPSPLLSSVSTDASGMCSPASTPPSTPKRSKREISTPPTASSYASRSAAGTPASCATALSYGNDIHAHIVTPTASSAAPGNSERQESNGVDHTFQSRGHGPSQIKDHNRYESVHGRAGQADGLLAARAKRGTVDKDERGSDPPAEYVSPGRTDNPRRSSSPDPPASVKARTSQSMSS